MSTPKRPEPAKLVIGVFLKDKDLFKQVFAELEENFGRADIVSRWFDFNFTDYYTKEMGLELFRRMTVFRGLIKQDDLAEIKNITNDIEKKFKDKEKRKVNIDPGYMLPSRFILATGKDYSHRVYIGKKIYADLTLIFKNGDFHTLEWTYPDYAAKDMKEFLLKVREKYLLDLSRSN